MDYTVPVGDMAVLATEPNWDYQLGQNGLQRGDLMVCCLLQGMKMVSNKVVSFDKLCEIKSGHYSKLITIDPSPIHRPWSSLPRRSHSPNHPFDFPVITRYSGWGGAEDGHQTPIQELVKVAFKVFNAREETPASS